MRRDVLGDIWLGLDVGTQSVRAIAVSSSGEVLSAHSERLTSHRSGPRHEQNPEHWWRALATACRAALADLPRRAIRGVAVDSTSGTILLMDQQGQPLTSGYMHDDNRAVPEAQRANEVGAAVWAELGYHMQPSWALPKLLWILREYRYTIASPRALLHKGVKVAHQTDFINRRLIGHEVPTDTSSALKTGYDLIKNRWPREVFAQLAIPAELLPHVVLSGTPIGAVSAQAAIETSIPRGTTVIAGMTDSCAAQISAGAMDVGSWNSVLGTTLAFKGVTQELIRDPAGVMYSHRSPDGGWLPGGASGVGAGILSTYFPGRDFDTLSAQAMEREPASIVAYPLASSGERFPFSAPTARHFLLGKPTDEIDLYAALLQGVAFVERLSFDYLTMLLQYPETDRTNGETLMQPPTPRDTSHSTSGVPTRSSGNTPFAPANGTLSLTGGGARNHYWCQLRADVLGRPVRIPENAESALGMAILAASAGRRVAHVAQEMCRIREVIDPRPGHTARFQEPYIRLIDELERRGWLPPQVAQYARR